VSPYAGERGEWDDFVRSAPGGTFFHRIGWKEVLESAFGFRSHYLVARRGGGMVGVLPVFELRAPFLGSCLQSVPLAVEGGVCAVDADAARVLEEAVVALARERSSAYVELRDGRAGGAFTVKPTPYSRFRRPLPPTDEEGLAALPQKRRNVIRKGLRGGLAARVGPQDLAAFYDLYARSVRRLGTPVFARRYFELLLERFPEVCVLLTVRREETPVAGVLSFLCRDAILPYYAGSRREWHGAGVNCFMYWELMCWARRRGLGTFDFGRSKEGTGAFDYKRFWGFAPEPLAYRVHVPGGAAPPARQAGAGLAHRLGAVWRHLPLVATKLIGPPLARRYAPFYT
jgi:FemAB-related protein (PEP-CTERM system-associated)